MFIYTFIFIAYIPSFIHSCLFLSQAVSSCWWSTTPPQIVVKLSPIKGNIYNIVVFNVSVHSWKLSVVVLYYCACYFGYCSTIWFWDLGLVWTLNFSSFEYCSTICKLLYPSPVQLGISIGLASISVARVWNKTLSHTHTHTQPHRHTDRWQAIVGFEA